MLVTKDGQQRLRFTESKTGADMDIPVAEPLAATIAATPMVGAKTFLVTSMANPLQRLVLATGLETGAMMPDCRIAVPTTFVKRF